MDYIFPLVLFSISLFLIFALILGQKKRKRKKIFEETLPNNAADNKVEHEKQVTLYFDEQNRKTYLWYFFKSEADVIEDFIPTDITAYTFEYKKKLMIFDDTSKKIAIIENCLKKENITIIPTNKITKIEPLIDYNDKTEVGGGVSPFSIKGYRIVSVTKKKLRIINKLYLIIHFATENQEDNTYTVKLLDGYTRSDSNKYKLTEIITKDILEKLEKHVENFNL